MFSDSIPLDCIAIPIPCEASWDEMSGTERVRFCSHCRLKVYNLSEMSRSEAEDVLREADGRLCVRLDRRPDGTILTRDCRVAIRAVRNKLTALTCLLGGSLLLTLMAALGILVTGMTPGGGFSWRRAYPFATILEWLDPTPPPPVLMGKICLPPGPGIREPEPAPPLPPPERDKPGADDPRQ